MQNCRRPLDTLDPLDTPSLRLMYMGKYESMKAWTCEHEKQQIICELHESWVQQENL